MKRSILICVIVFALMGCSLFGEPTTTTTARDTAARELLFDIADELNGLRNKPDYEDLEYTDDVDEQDVLGTADMVLTDRGKMEIDMMLAVEHKTALISLYFDTSDSLHTAVRELEILYIDTARDMYVDVSYCYEQTLYHDYMDPYIIDYVYSVLVSNFSTIIFEDVEWLLNELGYPVI